MSLFISTFRSRMLSLAGCAAFTAASLTSAALSQETTPGADRQAWAAAVSRESVPVRSGASENYYAFGTIAQGEIVGVVEEKFGWARVLTDGPAFSDFYGYVKVEDLRVAADGRHGTALGRVQVFAPNLERNGDPDASWKWITRIEAEESLTVLGTVAGENGEYYKVALPSTGEGWVSNNFLRRATAQEVEAWQQRHAPRQASPVSESQEHSQPVQVIDGAAGASNDQQTSPAEIVNVPQGQIENAEDGAEETAAESEAIGGANTQAAEAASPAEQRRDAAPAPEVEARKTFEALEFAYESLKKEAIRTSEIEPLRARYMELLEGALLDERNIVIARGRVQLLDARLELQERMLEVDRVRAEADHSAAGQERARIALEFAENYAAVGEVAVSTIYDGKRLPELLRLMDAATGRTIAYLQPDDEFTFEEKIGMLVGIVGEKYYDGGLRLQVISPRRVDLLQTVKQGDLATAVAAPMPDGE